MKILGIKQKNCEPVTIWALSYLERLENSHSVKTMHNFSISDLHWADLIYFHRPSEQWNLDTIELCKKLGKKTICLFDDDLLSLPFDHPGYLRCNETSKKIVGECAKNSDGFIVTNKEILNSFGGLNENHTIIPPTYPDEELKNSPIDQSNTKKIVLWRGSVSQKSMLEFSDAISSAGAKHPDWMFAFLGDYPWSVVEKLKNPWYCYNGFIERSQMWQVMKNYAPSICIAPRTDNQFTRSRSDMAFMDGVLCGAITLGPNWDEWDHGGVINYNNTKSFEDDLSSMMHRFNDDKNYNEEFAKGREFAIEYRSHSYAAKKHLEFLRGIL